MKRVSRYVISRLRLLALLGICQLAHWVATTRAVIDIFRGQDAKAHEIIVAYDRLGNAGTYGKSTEMVTYRAARGKREGMWQWCALCWLLDKLDPGHCERARP